MSRLVTGWNQIIVLKTPLQNYGIPLSHIFEFPSISNEKPSISIEILGISNQKFWNTRIFTT